MSFKLLTSFPLDVVTFGIQQVKAPEVHQLGIEGSGVKIGIMDTGIDYTNEDLNVVGGVTYVEGSTNYLDDNGHGTHVAGIEWAIDNRIDILKRFSNLSGKIRYCNCGWGS